MRPASVDYLIPAIIVAFLLTVLVPYGFIAGALIVAWLVLSSLFRL